MFKLVVLFSVAALAAAKPSAVFAPLTYGAVVPAATSYSQYSTGVVHGSPVIAPSVYSSSVLAPSVYSSSVYGPAVVPAVTTLSQAPHSPAVVLDAVNGVPLDTPEVVAARAAHYTAKALSGYHHLRKRSVAAVGVAPVSYSSVVSPLAYSGAAVVSAPYLSAYPTSVYTPYSAVYPKALSYHPY